MHKTVIIILLVLGVGNVQGSIVEFTEDWVIHPGDEYDVVSVLNDATVGMTGGVVWELYATEFSTINVFDGIVRSLYTYDSSNTYVYGGTIDASLCVAGSSTVSLFGGQQFGYVAIFDSGVLKIYGFGFEYEATGPDRRSGILSGYWLDGTPFNGMYLRMLPEPFPGSQIILTPEPGTLVILSLGGMILRRRMVSR